MRDPRPTVPLGRVLLRLAVCGVVAWYIGTHRYDAAGLCLLAAIWGELQAIRDRSET